MVKRVPSRGAISHWQLNNEKVWGVGVNGIVLIIKKAHENAIFYQKCSHVD